MSPIRRTISLILALALFACGLAVSVGSCFALWWKGWMVLASGTMAILGGLWLWEDFINATPKEQQKRPRQASSPVSRAFQRSLTARRGPPMGTAIVRVWLWRPSMPNWQHERSMVPRQFRWAIRSWVCPKTTQGAAQALTSR